ncbi:P-loop containing nucleoside triphosphate hydrolase protein [Cercophora newfieldiana]|uniref:P-loop containing nucleoside triphosphate hydrolase protein n=1 Tax=Cercophora newfieldiana TaxID=92897 RepID=A0AA39Y9K4_9PEZI|nr:P-loop containing nucleoside triphosphate hydrolase protein [Cercophora newfieldiana]
MAYATNGYGPGRHHETRVPGSMLSPNTAEEAQILAAMDKLRALGIDKTYDLPQIIVCGSQSAGKSSVLESLVQVPFPRSESTCTRYVTKVTILPDDAHRIEVRIQPGEDRKPAEVEFLNRFYEQDSSSDYDTKLGEFMRKADKAIFQGIDLKKVTFTKDVMLITVYGPNTRPLQVLDLPGLIAFDQKGQGNEHLIERIVTGYMAVKQSIILAVIKANEDLNNQKVLDLCKKYDPHGERTMGIITRPDVAEEVQKRNLIAVIQKRDQDGFEFRHRWHILRNRTSEEADTPQAMRDRVEEILLNTHPWNTIDQRCRGISELRERLRELLFSLAKRELPGLCDTFRDKLKRLDEEFNDLGGDEFKEGELQTAVTNSLSRLHKAARDHGRGVYGSDIRKKDYGDPVYLRSRVVERSEVFRDRLVADGNAWNTRIRPTPSDPDSDLGSIYRETEEEKATPESTDEQPQVQPKKTHPTLQAEIEEVAKMLKQTRGENLPTFLDPQSIKHLFWHMADGWDDIARAHVESVYKCCEQYFRAVTPIAFKRNGLNGASSGFANPDRVAGRFVGPHVVTKLQECRKNALGELLRLEQDRLAAPINADMRFLKDRRAHRQGREFHRAMKASHHFSPSGSGSAAASRLDQTSYADKAGLHSQEDLIRDTADTYLDAMWSHYLIERDIYITNVLRQVVERHFLRHIDEILPKSLTEAEMERLVQKDTVEEARKMEIKKDMAVLRQSLEALEGIR